MSFSDKLEDYFWNNLEKDEFIIDGINTSPLDEVIKLLTLNESEREKEIMDKPDLRKILGIENICTLEQVQEYSSDSEDGYTDTLRMVKEDDPESSNRAETNRPSSPLKRTREEREYDQPIIDEAKKVIAESKNSTAAFGMKVLNLDGIKDRTDLINMWATELSLLVQTNRHAYPDAKNVLLLVEHKTAGSVQQFIQGTRWLATDPIQVKDEVINGITYMFTGCNVSSAIAKENAVREARQKARLRLKNLQICDICFIEEFISDYEENLYVLPNSEYEELIKDFLLKIPIVGPTALQQFVEICREQQPWIFSFGLATKLVRDEIQKICDTSKKHQQLKKYTISCCKKIAEKSYQYGCKDKHYSTKNRFFEKDRSKYSYRDKNKSRYSYKKKFKRFKPGRYFKPHQKKNSEKDKSKDKQKFCPKGKKNCRCWICNVEGHYANECPNRQQYPQKIKLIEEIQDMGYEPVEDEYDSTEEVYLFKEIEDEYYSEDSE